jgi:hypothetical protein
LANTSSSILSAVLHAESGASKRHWHAQKVPPFLAAPCWRGPTRPLAFAVHDHIIVGKDGHASFRGLKLIWRLPHAVVSSKRQALTRDWE